MSTSLPSSPAENDVLAGTATELRMATFRLARRLRAQRAVVEETVRRRDAWLEQSLAELTDDERAALAEAAAIMRKVADA